MLRTPNRTAISASFVVLAAVFVPQTSHAATDDCLAAPKGAAPQGQHWYYHLDRATQRKCWYLHETIAKPAAATSRSNSSTRPSAASETNHSTERATSSAPRREASAQPTDATSAESRSSHSGEATGAIAAPASTNATTAPPLQPAGEPSTAQGAATLWSNPPQPAASASVQDAAGAPSDNPPADVANPTDVGDTTMEDALAQPDQTPMTAAAPENPSPHSVAQDLLIIALAALMAGMVSVAVAVLRGRKPVTAKLAGFIELAAGLIDAAFAKFAALRRPQRAKARPAAVTPNIDSRHDRQSDWRPRPQSRKDGSPQPAPAQMSLIPEQITMARPFVAPRQQARVNRDRRARVE